jgi:hypothetical protein
MSLVDELRELAAGATPGAIVPPSQDVRRITTAAADRLELLETVVAAARDFHEQAVRKLADPDAPLADRLAEQLWRLNASEMRYVG